jgi:tRNA A-37 threonylcarbamoyl transferase component Bud32/tetratricopeptide (TPR) repeat protein
VRDLTNQRVVALKRLTGHHTDNDPIARLFEREFCTLSQLVHPRIIEVYDYQTDDGCAFYTMELLSGGDLRKRSPIAWSEACRLLCDVCSALSLLHSRRFVHRDLTPLNVRITADGRAKLIDFGSMAQFGRSRHVVGTPPFVAPESLSGQVIDGTTDLYALGASAYYALTGRHAYPARNLSELPELWQCAPAPPSHHVPGIPPALDELVLALLSPQQSGRPSNAAEVMERLSAIAGFELEEALRIRDAYVSTPTLVGRAGAQASVDKHLRRALEGQGGALLVTGARGAGRSRFLDACRLQGKLRGALVLSAAAEETARQPWEAASLLLEQLRGQAPELSAELVAPHAAAFAFLRHPQPQEAGPPRAELQVRLREAFLGVAARRPLLIAVDDIDRIDEPSAALFALLAHHAAAVNLLLVATADNERVDPPPKPLELLADIATEISLPDLQETETQALVSSVFGAVANVRLLGDRIHAASGGNPGRVMHLCRHMVGRGRVRYAAGQWTLPSKIDVDELSIASHDRLDDNLSAPALELARAMALAGSAARSFDECLKLSGQRERKRLYADLHTLCVAGVLSMDADRYRVSGPSWEALLLRDLDRGLERKLHARLAEFLADQPHAQFRVVQHLLQAGEQARALDLWLTDEQGHRLVRMRDPIVTSEYLQSLPKNWSETFHALIAACEELGRPLSERLALQGALLAYSTLSARSESATLRAVVEQLRRDAGLDVYEALGDTLNHDERLQRALETAQRRYDDAPPAERGLPVGDAIIELARTILQANGLVGRTLDYALLSSLPSLAPLSQLSPALDIVQRAVDSTLHILAGRMDHALDGFRDVTARLEQPGGVAGLDEVHRAAMHPAIVFAMASIEAQAGRPIALLRVALLHETPWFAVSALRLQTIHALFQGDVQTAERCRAQTELYEIQNQPPQLLEGTHLMQWMFGCTLMHDIAGVKQSIAEIDAMAEEYDTWKPLSHCARGNYQALRGDYARALPEFESAMRMMTPGRHAAWLLCAAAHVNALLRLGRMVEASSLGSQYLVISRREQFGRAESELLLRLAEAQSVLGEHERAIENIQTAIAGWSCEGATGVRLGEAYELRAWIALRMSDAVTFGECASLAEAQYRLGGGHPTLLARHEKLTQAARKAGLIAQPSAADAPDSSLSRSQFESQMSTVFNQARNPEQRAQQALERLLRKSRSSAGCLYLVKGQYPLCVAKLGALCESVDVDARVVNYLLEQAHLHDATDTKSATNPPEVTWSDSEHAEFQLVPMLLSHSSPDGRVLTGVAVMQVEPGAALRTPVRLLQTLSRAFHESGDSTAHSHTGPTRDAN